MLKQKKRARSFVVKKKPGNSFLEEIFCLIGWGKWHL